MSISINGKNAEIHVFSTHNFSGKLNANQVLLYLTPFKLGKVSRNSSAGLTPDRAFRERYKNQRSSMAGNMIASDFFVVDKNKGEEYDYDEAFRKYIHILFKAGLIPFDALYKGYQKPGQNAEALINFDRDSDLETLKEVLRNFCGLSDSFNSKESISWRYKQFEDAIEIVEKLETHSICLYAAHTARGKTKIASEVAARLLPTGGIVLVTTPITDTKKSFEDNIKNYHFGPNRDMSAIYLDNAEFNKYSISELRDKANNGELVYVVLTVQDARYNDSYDLSDDVLREKYAELSDNIDLWIRDERHFQYNGDKTSKRLANIDARYILDLTATPYNVLDKYSADQIIARTLPWGLQHKNHTKLPNIAINAINTPFCNVNNNISHLFSTEEGFTPIKLFLRQNNQFLMQSDIVETFDRFYHSPISRNKNPLSIINDPELSMVSKNCGLVVLPAGQGNDSANSYIPALAKMLNASSKTFFIDSYSLEKMCPDDTSIGDYVDTLISKHGRVIILTCGKFLTGTDIPALGHIVLFDKMDSISSFEQLLGRMIRNYDGKDDVKLYALSPGASLQIVLGRLAKSNAILNEGTEYDFLDCIPLSEYVADKYVVVDPDTIMDSTRAWCKDQVSVTLSTTQLQSALKNIDLSFFRYSNLQSGIQSTETTLTDVTGAVDKVQTKPDRKESSDDKISNNDLEKAITLIKAISLEASWVAYSMNNYNFEDVYTSDAITGMFGSDIIQHLLIVISNSEKLEQLIRSDLLKKQQAFAALPPREVYSDLFKNSAMKQKLGLVYVDFEVADKLVSEIPFVDTDESITVDLVVFNALNGTIPLAIKDRYSNVNVTCVETFPYFNAHLSQLGFNVIPWDDFITMNKEVHLSKFSVYVGNPPYQQQDGGNGSSAKPIYQLFVNKAIEDDPEHILMITPSRWMTGGKGLDKFRAQMLADTRINVIHDYHSSKELFPNVEIKGGVCYFRWDRDGSGDCQIFQHYSNGVVSEATRPLKEPGNKVFIRNNDAIQILKKVQALKEQSMFETVHPRNPFGLVSNFTNFHENEFPNSVKTYARHKIRYTDYAVIPKNHELIEKHKVLVPNATGSGDGLKDVLKPIYGEPGSCCTETYIVTGAFDTEDEARNLISYINTKFFHFMLTLKKNTHVTSRKEYMFIPVQDFTKPWTDEELFNKYGLTDDEVANLLGSVR
jgi:hypothetical protein